MIGRSLAEFDEMSKIKLESSKHIKQVRLCCRPEFGLTGAIRLLTWTCMPGKWWGWRDCSVPAAPKRPAFCSALKSRYRLHFDERYSGPRPLPAGSIKRGVALCPEDRKAAGIVDDLTVGKTSSWPCRPAGAGSNYLSLQEQYEYAEKYIEAAEHCHPFRRSAGQKFERRQPAKSDPGPLAGDQPAVLILDEPTRGIDVGTKAEIQKLVLSLAEEGKACVFISSELEEVLRTSHRIVVLREREKVAEFSGEVDENTIIHAIAGSEA
jgi:galactofuranose transport system ATP-binding protein